MEFTRAGVPEQLETTLNGRRWPALLGRDGFEEWVDNNFVPAIKDREIISPVLGKRLTVKQVVNTVSAASDVSWHKIKRAKRGEDAVWRKLAILALRCELGLTYSKIARCVGGIDPSQISRLLYREKKDLEKRSEWLRLVSELRNAKVKT